jgi:hypothetical protein
MRMRLAVWMACFVASAAYPLIAVAVEPAKAVVVLVDLSDSTVEARGDYRAYFKMILNSLRENDRLLVGFIGKDASNVATIRINEAIPERHDLLEQEFKYRGKIRRQLEKAATEFDAMLREQSSETPIIDSMREVERLYASFPAPRKILVLFSDMKEYTHNGPSLEGSRFSMTSQQAQAAATKLAEQRRVANLSGVRVYVAGARDKEPSRVAAVQEFWSAYFRAARAQLSPTNYGSALLAFPECTDCRAVLK